MTYKIYIFIILTLGSFFFASAQSERKITRKGNTHYETGNFIDAEINYKKALAKNADLLEAQFNLGDALVKQERFDEALEAFEKVSASTENQNLKANALHNKGNVLLSQQDLEGAIESYKDALRINPKDQETRYNYAYVKKLLEQQQQQQNQDQPRSINDTIEGRDRENTYMARKPVSVVVDRSKAKGKKLRATFTYSDGSRKTTNFGGAGYEDFTIHKDPMRKKRYLDRHQRREDWNDPTSAGALSRWILWNDESLSESFEDYISRFDLEGDLRVKRSGGR